VIGRRPYFFVGATRHGSNLFTAIAGQTARGRKGTSWDYLSSILGAIDPQWMDKHVHGGLSTGEGLISLAGGGMSEGESPDSRLLFLQDELSSVLRVMTRPTSTLSTTLRRAWDGGRLQISTKEEPLLVKNAHISLIGHITLPDLFRYMGVADVFGGLFNRILWCCSRRSKILPFGGQLPKGEFDRIVNCTRAALDFASKVGMVELSRQSKALWQEEYVRITNAADVAPLVDAVTARGEAQVRRLSMIYAIADMSPIVKLQHLRAGLEVWRYCNDSAQYIFERTKGPSLTQKIIQLLPVAGLGLSRTQISHALSGHSSSSEIKQALDDLQTRNLAKSQKIVTAGRSAETWIRLRSREV
jgi:hypothetical protein